VNFDEKMKYRANYLLHTSAVNSLSYKQITVDACCEWQQVSTHKTLAINSLNADDFKLVQK
jgi:hypothetical protein